MSTLRDRSAAPRRRTLWWLVVFAVTRLMAMLATWRRRARSRRALARFAAHELRDIGISEGERWHECAKPFWRG
ncbi:MAG TPA: DUF1127 domain-containing protein [Stellaceae bacterium]|nr:DUF1127 domain-containing protein [Stellaceae bacterium]